MVDLPLHMLFPTACHQYFEEAEQDPLFQTLKEQIMAPVIISGHRHGRPMHHPFFVALDRLWDPQFANYQSYILRSFVSAIENPFRDDEVSRGIETTRGMLAGRGIDEGHCSPELIWQADQPVIDGGMAGIMIAFLTQKFESLKKRGIPRAGPQTFFFGTSRCNAYVASAQSWSPE
ncbi:hypothetical protein C8J56DRAFT_1050554 [Mycena floridula]|nr:hypothetical protein C8J56DRAFT_1050554 [Mycena floridula]